MKYRIDKFLSDMGIGTRQEIKNLIKQKRVAINGKTVATASEKADTEADEVMVDNTIIEYAEYEYYILNKPAGVITATTDKHEKTVLDLIDCPRRDLFPVGRLDKDTEGLLIITNDGALSHNLLSPKRHVDKKYFVRVEGRLDAAVAEKFAGGLVVDEEFTALPATLELLGDNEAYITISEGKFHQIKRMMEAVGCTVIYLKRISMGRLNLPEELMPGESRPLTPEELNLLKDNY